MRRGSTFRWLISSSADNEMFVQWANPTNTRRSMNENLALDAVTESQNIKTYIIIIYNTMSISLYTYTYLQRSVSTETIPKQQRPQQKVHRDGAVVPLYRKLYYYILYIYIECIYIYVSHTQLHLSYMAIHYGVCFFMRICLINNERHYLAKFRGDDQSCHTLRERGRAGRTEREREREPAPMRYI